MNQATASNVTAMATLVVTEEGAPHAVPVGDLGGLAMIQQDPDEPYLGLAERVARAVERIERSGHLQSAWLLLNHRRDRGAFDGRATIARTIAAALVRAGGGKLVLVVDPGRGAEGRSGLFSLVGGLLEADTPASVTVRVCFNPAWMTLAA